MIHSCSQSVFSLLSLRKVDSDPPTGYDVVTTSPTFPCSGLDELGPERGGSADKSVK